MAERRRRVLAGLAALVAFSLVVCPLGRFTLSPAPARAQVPFTFTPRVTRLAVTQTAEALRIEYLEGEGGQEDEVRILLAEGLWRIDGLDSSEAIERCGGEAFTFGGATAGMCLIPGGETYYIWTSRGEVLEIEARPGDPNQAGFRSAVEAMASDLAHTERDRTRRAIGAIGLGVAFAGILPACATILGCYVGVLAAMAAVGNLAYANGNVMEDEEALALHTQQADYFYCLLLGRDDITCREEAGGTHE